MTLVPFGRVPKVAVTLTVQAGRINERVDQVSLSEVTAALMNEGTRTRSAAAVADAVGDMGGSLDATAARVRSVRRASAGGGESVGRPAPAAGVSRKG